MVFISMGLLGFEPRSDAPKAPILDQTRRQPRTSYTLQLNLKYLIFSIFSILFLKIFLKNGVAGI